MRASEQPFDFGDWRLDPARGILRAADGREARLEPQLVDLLVLFAGSGGRVLRKDEIVEAVWGGRAIGDDTLAAAVSRLRRALGETRGRQYIETVPKRGYRCVVASVEAGPPSGSSRVEPASEAATLSSRGWQALAVPLAPNLAQARMLFDAAIAADPAYAPAHRGLAECLMAQHGADMGQGLLATAKASASAAVGLDAASAPAWSTLGLALLLADRDFRAADEALRRAIALGSGVAAAHRNRALTFASVGRFVEAEREGRKAVDIDPYALEARGLLLQILLAARRYGQAVAEANAALTLAAQSSDAWYNKGWALAFAGDQERGMDALLKGLALWGADSDRLGAMRAVFDQDGFAAGCRAAADMFDAQSVMLPHRLTDTAILRALAGQADQAFEALEGAVDRDAPMLMLLPWLPHFDPLRADPRYARLLRRLRLVR